MRHSIKLKFFGAVAAVSVVFIALISVLNLFFYDDYYMYERQNALRTLYRDVVQSFDGTLESIYPRLLHAEDAQGVRLTVLSQNGLVVYDTTLRQLTSDTPMNVPQLFGSGDSRNTFFTDFNLTARALQEADSEQLTREGCDLLTLSTGQSEYLYLVGRLGDSRYLISRTAIAYMETNSTFNSTFLLIAGAISLLVGLLPAYLLSRRFTDPLIAMSQAADAMAALDFSRKIETTQEDEIGQLGRSLNLLSEHLEAAVNKLQRSNDQLARENAEKERIDTMRREFIVNVSHELKTPIALIRGYAEGLREGIAEDPEDRKYYCDTICDEAIRMNELVLQLLRLSKLEEGHELAEFAPVELAPLCAAEVEKVAPLAAERGLQLDCTVAPHTLTTDEDLLGRILSNYLTNAIRYTPDGGRISLSAAHTPEGVTLRVFNEGEGVAEHELDRLWEKFYRTDKARSRASGGTGIGLSIVRAAAEVLGARVWAANEPGGIAFYVALPT